MSFVDRRVETRPTSGEAPFGLNEVFFSRTDSRGVIRAGNYVFRRVGAYPWEELIGAPHKVIRHPDMPKGVFSLFWDTIQRGESIGAYVKNKAKDGLYYWVFAVVVPCGDGYLSARIKPSSKLFDEVRGLYAKMLKREKDEGVKTGGKRPVPSRLAQKPGLRGLPPVCSTCPQPGTDRAGQGLWATSKTPGFRS